MSEPRCPNCGGRRQFHSQTEWCMECGWARNRPKPLVSGAQLLNVLNEAWDNSPVTQRRVASMLGLSPQPKPPSTEA